ncbi:MAG TPA: response regulator transcription factor, partial [Gemmatimonadales bacterium]|nr:response regulator transcription factor [Gemmatimonadales bacterium]
MRDEIVRVVLVDDHTIVREGLRLLLRSAPDIAVVGEAVSGLTAIDVAERLRPDIVVLDLDMPGSDGMATLRGLEQALPEVRVLVLTVHAERERLVPLLEAGARGYLTK